MRTASASASRSHAPRPDSRIGEREPNSEAGLTITYDEPEEDGWIVARIYGVPGAISEGPAREEARENVIDALRLILAPDGPDENAGRRETLELLLQS